MSEITTHFNALLTVTDEALAIIVLMGAFTAYLVRLALDSRPIATTFFPFLVYSGLLANHLALKNGIFVTSDKEAQAAAAAGFGMMVALLVLFVAMRVVNEVWGVYVRHQNSHLSRSGSGHTA